MTGPPAAGVVLPEGLLRALTTYALRPRVLLALDFDGVLAPIVDDPDTARPLPQAGRALQDLTGRPGVLLALVSGRSLEDLRRLAAPPEGAVLVGSHGAEVDGPDGAPSLDDAAAGLLARLREELAAVGAAHPGTHVERKPSAVVLHTRRADRDVAAAASHAAQAGPGGWDGVYVTVGKEVVELSVVDTDKGGALLRLREDLGIPQGCVLYAGDDTTDERAFAVLDQDAGDVAVKVGDGPSAARHRVAGPPEVAALLLRLAELRT